MNRTAPNSVAKTRRTSDRRSAFTLIELLVVIFILGILVTLVVSISGYILDKANRDQTLANQKVILTAIGAFHDIMGNYPLDTDAALYSQVPDPPTGLTTEQLTGWVLLQYLNGTRALYPPIESDMVAMRIRDATGKCLLNLPADAFGEDFDGFRDAYGQYMEYSSAGGLGGRPAIISAGPDGQFRTTDDIRSDGR